MTERVIRCVIYIPKPERLRALDDAEKGALLIPIPQTEKRKKMGQLLSNACWARPRIFGSRRSSEFLKEIGKLGEVEIYEERNIKEDTRSRMTCAQYVFGITLGKNWGFDIRNPDSDPFSSYFWNETTLVLREKGYRILTMGEAFRRGDVILYRKKRWNSEEIDREAVHFGLLDIKENVISKFGGTYVYRHAIGNIPEDYGDYAFFYRKISR